MVIKLTPEDLLKKNSSQSISRQSSTESIKSVSSAESTPERKLVTAKSIRKAFNRTASGMSSAMKPVANVFDRAIRDPIERAFYVPDKKYTGR